MHFTDLFFFFFNDTAPTEIYTLSLHDALPIYEARARARRVPGDPGRVVHRGGPPHRPGDDGAVDRKSTRLNSSHTVISYAVFCLKKKKKKKNKKINIYTMHELKIVVVSSRAIV